MSAVQHLELESLTRPTTYKYYVLSLLDGVPMIQRSETYHKSLVSMD
jgi:hypothetical protein